MRFTTGEHVETTTVEELTKTGRTRIVQIVPMHESDNDAYGYLALVEFDL